MLGFMNVNYEIGDRTIHKQQDRDRVFKQDRKRRSLFKNRDNKREVNVIAVYSITRELSQLSNSEIFLKSNRDSPKSSNCSKES